MSQSMPEIDSEQTQLLPVNTLSTLLDVSNALASTLDLAEILQTAINSVTDLLEIETGAVYILNQGNLFLGATTPPLPAEFPEELRQARLEDHVHLKRAMNTRQPVYLNDARSAVLTDGERVVVESRNLVSILFFPLMLKEMTVGAFIIGTTHEPRRFSQNEISICHILSTQSALAITNARLFEDTQRAVQDLIKAYDDTLIGWSHLLDLRDHITEEHTHRVTALTIELARRLGIPESELEHIRRGALLHDIGKMGIPDEILQKPTPLTEAEMAIMRMHPDMGYQILSQIDFLEPALDIPYCHHERWDGTGYPRKLKGEEIPLTARIFAVADVWDALTSHRPYRSAWSRTKALEHIRSQSGKDFDPKIVEVFLQMISDPV